METYLTATRVEWHLLASCIKIRAIQTTAVSYSSLQHAAPLLHLLQAAALRTLCQALVPDSTRFPVTQVGTSEGLAAPRNADWRGQTPTLKQCVILLECLAWRVGSHLPIPCVAVPLRPWLIGRGWCGRRSSR